jgi:hypothetical protein
VADREVSSWSGRSPESAYATGANAAVFMTFVAAGCAYIVLAKFGGMGQFYVTFVPVGTMLAYALLISLARGLRLRDDQSGDNLYYMGFLFTLTSLGVSLYQFTASRAAEEIVQNFGIAIGSTITGIGLRVIFNQMRRDPVEIERVMRLELAEAARRVKRELDSTVVEFGHHRRSAQQAAADSFSHVSEKFDEIADKFLRRLDELSATLASPIAVASRESADAISDVSKTIGEKFAVSAWQLSAESELLSKRAATISPVLDELTAKLGAMQTPDRVIEVRLEPMAQALSAAVDRLTAQSDGQASAVKDAVATANASTERSIDLVGALRQEFDQAATTNRAIVETATNMIKVMEQVLDEFRTNSRDYVDALVFMLDKTDATMRTFTDVIIKSGVEAAMQSEGLRDLLPAIEASAHSVAAAAARISDAMDDRSRRPTPKRETID